MKQSYRINIALIGSVSVGKTTLLNTLFIEQYSDMKIIRTTMLPQIYHESLYSVPNTENILLTNRSNNEEIMKKTIANNKLCYRDIKELEHFVPKITEFVSLKSNLELSIYDLPGLNDSVTKNIYIKYINENFYKFDIVLWLIDVQSAMNTSDEMDIFKLIIRNIIKNKDQYDITTKMIVLVNKCDDMTIQNNNFIFSDTNILEMYQQITTIIESKIHELCELYESNFIPNYQICPISCESAYIYRMYKKNSDIELESKYLDKFGNSEYGKSLWNKLSPVDKKQYVKKFIESTDYNERIEASGFLRFRDHLQVFLSDPYPLIINHLKYEICNIPIKCTDVKIFSDYQNKIITINNLFDASVNDCDTLKNLLVNKINDCYVILDADVNKIVNKTANELENISTSNIEHDFFIFVRLNVFYNWANEYKKIILFLYDINITTGAEIYISIHKTYQFIINLIYKFNIMDAAHHSILQMKLRCVDNLIKFEYPNLKIFLQSCILSSDFMSKTSTDKLTIINGLVGGYGLDENDVINLIFSILDIIYAKDLDKNYFSKFKFWNNIIIKSTNEYYDIVCNLKCILNKFPIFKLDRNKNDDNALEEYLFAHIKYKHPNDVYTNDMVIDFLNQTKCN